MAAKTADKSMEEVASSVISMEKLLKMHGANPAEVKAQKKEDKELRNKEKDLVNKWLDVVDDEKKELTKRTQSFSSMTGFIGIETRKYFAQTERNMVTWGGLAGSIKEGVKDWFKATMQQRTMLGATLRLGASLWKATHDHLIGSIKNVFGKITSQAREVLGDLAEVFDAIKGVFVGAFKFLKDTFLGVFEKVPPHQRKRNRILQKMLNYFTRREKIDLIGAGKKKRDSGLSLFMIAGMIAAGLLGALIRKFLLPFELVYKGLRMKSVMTWVKGFLGKFRMFARVMRWFKELKMSFLLKWIVWGQKFATFMPKFSGVLKLLFGALKLGFKVFGWPLTILLAVIDFIRGFVATEGNLADKILGGLKKAVMGFLELPVRLFGWIVEKVLGLFGIKVDGVADKILGVVEWILEGIVAWFRPLYGFLEGFFSTDGNLIDKLIGGFKGWLDGMMDFFKFLTDSWDSFASFFGFGKGEEEEPKPGKPKGTSPVETGGFLDETGATVDAVSQIEANSKMAQQNKSTKAVVNALDKQTKEQIKANEKIAKENPGIAIGMGGSGYGGGGGAPPPDTTREVDDTMMIFNQNEF